MGALRGTQIGDGGSVPDEAGLDDRIRARSEDEREALIQPSLERYGTRRRSSEEIKRDSVFYGSGSDTEDDPMLLEEESRRRAYKAILDAQIVRSESWSDLRPVPFDEVEPRLRRYLELDDDVSEGSVQDLKDRLVAHDAVREQRRDETVMYELSPEATHEVLSQGRSETAGKETHRFVLRQTYFVLTQLGFDIDLIYQSGSDQPDAYATLPHEFSENPYRQRRELAQLRSEEPSVYALSAGGPISVEAEVSTALTNPNQTAKNIARAYENDTIALLAVPEGDDDDPLRYARAVWQTVTSDRIPEPVTPADVRVLILPDDDTQEAMLYRDGETVRLSEINYGTEPETTTDSTATRR